MPGTGRGHGGICISFVSECIHAITVRSFVKLQPLSGSETRAFQGPRFDDGRREDFEETI